MASAVLGLQAMTMSSCARAGIGRSGPVRPECVAPAGAATDTADIACAVNGRKIDEEPKTGLAAVVRAAVVRGLRQQFIRQLKCRRRRDRKSTRLNSSH